MRPTSVGRTGSVPSCLSWQCADGMEGQRRGRLGCLPSATDGWLHVTRPSCCHMPCHPSLVSYTPAARPAVRSDHLGAPSAAQLLGARPAAALLCLPDGRAGPVAAGGAESLRACREGAPAVASRTALLCMLSPRFSPPAPAATPLAVALVMVPIMQTHQRSPATATHTMQEAVSVVQQRPTLMGVEVREGGGTPAA